MSICAFLLSDASDADTNEDYVTVTGTVSVEGIECTSDQFQRIIIHFISESDVKIAVVGAEGSYSVSLKSNTEYTVKSFNYDAQNKSSNSSSEIFKGDGLTEMSFLYYKSVTTGATNLNLDIMLEKAYDFTDQNGNEYYLYKSGIATLTKINVEYEKLQERPFYKLKEQTITIPEFVSSEGKTYEVIFVGKQVTVVGGGVIPKPSDNSSDVAEAIFCESGNNTLTIVFEGNVTLNTQPFTAPFEMTNRGYYLSSQFNFHIIFEKDVSINNYINKTLAILGQCSGALTAVKKITVLGTYQGAIYWNKNTNVLARYDNNSNLANSNFDIITFDVNLLPKYANTNFNGMYNTKIDNLGLPTGSKLVATADGEQYKITTADGKTVCCYAKNVVTDPLTVTIVTSDEITYSLVKKGEIYNPAEPTITTENQRFAGWYTDAEYTKRYDTSVALTADTTVYAKIVTLTDNQVLFTTVVDGVKYYNVVSKATYTPENPVSSNKNLKLTWYTDAEYTTKYDASVALTKDTTVYAKFKVVSATVNLVEDGKILKSYENIAEGKTITLQTSETKGFEGWSINGLLLGAQYTVSLTDADSTGNITLTAKITEEVKTTWDLKVTGTGIDGKVFCTASNLIGTYGMITVLPGEFEEFGYEIKSANAVVGEISDSCLMVSSKDGKDVEISIEFKDVGKAAEYTVSIAEITADGKSGFRATLTADDGGYIDTDGTLAIGYVYKVYNETEKAWVYTTSGSTEGVTDCTVEFKDKAVKTEVFSGDFTLDKTGAYLVYGYAKYSYKDASSTSTTVTVTSPVIVSFVSTVQAVIGKS